MNATPDRRVATAVVASVALVFAIVISGAPRPVRPSDAVLKSLVQFMVRGGRTSARVDYVTHRTTPAGQVRDSTVTNWFRAAPYLSMDLAGDALRIVTTKRGAQCVTTDLGIQCLPVAARATPDDGSMLAFGAVRTAHRYALTDHGSRRVAGEVAQCFRLTLRRGEPAVAAFGDRLDVCYAADGVVLASEISRAGTVDTRTAVAVHRGVTQTEIDQLLRKHATANLRGIAS